MWGTRHCLLALLAGALGTGACSSFTDAGPDAGDASSGDAGSDVDAGPPRFVQAVANHSPLNDAGAIGTSLSIDVQFPFNRAGDLIILSVYWDTGNDSVLSVTDEGQNSYRSVVGPTKWNGASNEQLFYARNIADRPDRNTVTVQLGAAASDIGPYAEVRAFEYAGLPPDVSVDAVAAGGATNGPIDTGPIMTSYPMDLVFGIAQYSRGDCNSTSVLSLSADSTRTFTPRSVSEGGGILAVDAVVAQPAPEHVGYSLDCTPGSWVAQIAAFH